MSAHMTEDQTLLQDAAERYLRDSYDFNQRRERIAGGVYSDPDQWQAFAEMGWLALPVAEEFGGLGMGTREMAILAELCGQFLVTEPLIDALTATHAIIGVSQQQENLLPRVAEGELIPVVAIDEAETASRLSPATTLTQNDGGVASHRREALDQRRRLCHPFNGAGAKRGRPGLGAGPNHGRWR
ncbi:MAG: acyl-CoA dehydrogenase family protein [Luminiphilus sp.]